jgi:Tfp pilus assembly protein PilF
LERRVLQHVLHACNELRVMQTVAQLELPSRVTNHLSLLFYRQEKRGEAEQMYQRALASHNKTYGTETLTVQLLGIVNNLGNFYRKQGRSDEAEGMFWRALAGREKLLNCYCIGMKL